MSWSDRHRDAPTSLAGAAGREDFHAGQRERFRALNRWQVITAFVVSSAALGTNVVYFLATPEEPHRAVHWVLQLVAISVGVIAIRPPRWLRATRIRRSLVLHVWAASQFVIIGLAAALDGGLSGPMPLLLFFPLSVAAVGFDPQSVWLHGTTAIATVLAVGWLTGTSTIGHTLLWPSALLTTALVGSTVARRQRGLTRELAATNDELHRLARTDPLTGCLNRRSFHEELDGALLRHDRDGTTLVVLLLDIDEFKQVNDRHGHPVGDEVLVAVAATLRANVRDTDLVARTGGEEFAVLLPDTGLNEAAPIAERLRRSVAQAGCEVTVTASAGLAAVPDHAITSLEVVRVADRAMYAAKHAGRDRLVVASA